MHACSLLSTIHALIQSVQYNYTAIEGTFMRLWLYTITVMHFGTCMTECLIIILLFSGHNSIHTVHVQYI